MILNCIWFNHSVDFLLFARFFFSFFLFLMVCLFFSLPWLNFFSFHSYSIRLDFFSSILHVFYYIPLFSSRLLFLYYFNFTIFFLIRSDVDRFPSDSNFFAVLLYFYFSFLSLLNNKTLLSLIKKYLKNDFIRVE